MINIEDFLKVQIKIGKIISAEDIEGSEKLLKLSVDFGEENPKQILSGVAKVVSDPCEMVGKQAPFITNLEPRIMMGLESNGMMLCVDDGSPVFLHPTHEVTLGSVVK